MLAKKHKHASHAGKKYHDNLHHDICRNNRKMDPHPVPVTTRIMKHFQAWEFSNSLFATGIPGWV